MPLVGTFAGNCLKKFFPCEARIEDQDVRDSVLSERDRRLEAERRSFTERYADRLRELQEMASGNSQVNESEGSGHERTSD